MPPSDALPESTLDDVPAPAGRRRLWPRRAGVAVLSVVVLAGAGGLFGVRTGTVVARAGSWTVSVDYPRIARAGLDVDWRVTVRAAGGLPDRVTLAVSSRYVDLFEQQGSYPEADSTTNDGRFVYLTYTAPRGDTLVVDFDLYVQPGAQTGRTADLRVVAGGRPVVATSFRTWLVP